MIKYSVLFLLMCMFMTSYSQSDSYTQQKQKKLAVKSPFEKIVDRELPADIVYEDNEIIAFVPLRRQAPVHFLIVPKKRITTMNEATREDVALIGKMMLKAAELAKEYKIDETGYRLSLNTNEDSGQSVFHIHLHLIGGAKLGPMVDQTYKDPRSKD